MRRPSNQASTWRPWTWGLVIEHKSEVHFDFRSPSHQCTSQMRVYQCSLETSTLSRLREGTLTYSIDSNKSRGHPHSKTITIPFIFLEFINHKCISSCSTRIWWSWCNTAQPADSIIEAILVPYTKLFFTTLVGSIIPYAYKSPTCRVFALNPYLEFSRVYSKKMPGSLLILL